MRKLDKISANFQKLKKKGETWVNKSRSLVTLGQLFIDIANEGEQLLSYNPIIINEDDINQVLFDLISHEIDFMASNDSESVYSSTSGSVVTSMIHGFDPAFVLVDVDKESLYVNEFKRLTQIQKRMISKERVILLMKEFKLNEEFMGEKSPLELFETAHAAFEGPVMNSNPVSSSLIPMRSSLTHSIEKLLKERMYQERAGSNELKIRSIAKQLKKSEIFSSTTDSWVTDYDRLIKNELSPAKTGNMDRIEWLRILNSSTFFLQNLLLGLDTNKLRSNKK